MQLASASRMTMVVPVSNQPFPLAGPMGQNIRPLRCPQSSAPTRPFTSQLQAKPQASIRAKIPIPKKIANVASQPQPKIRPTIQKSATGFFNMLSRTLAPSFEMPKRTTMLTIPSNPMQFRGFSTSEAPPTLKTIEVEAPKARAEDDSREIKNLFQPLEHPMLLENLLVKPNATHPEDIPSIINGNGLLNLWVPTPIGHLIKPGQIGIVEHNGRVFVVGPGRYNFPHPRTKFRDVVSLSDNIIKFETLSIIRVTRGEIGLATYNGNPLLLAEGIHVKNDRLFEFHNTVPYNSQRISHGSLTILRVPEGSYGLVNERGIPKVLPEGCHVTDTNSLEVVSVVSQNTPYIAHRTLHILRIPDGQVALVLDNNKPKLLSGTHYIDSKTFQYHGMQNLDQQVIKNGPITRFRVRKGELGLAWEDNQPMIFEEGIYNKNSPQFQFVTAVDASDQQIILGSKKIITVRDGEVGVSYIQGKLNVLPPNRHLIDNPDHIFEGFLSTQQQCLHLFDEKDKNSQGLLSCETKDFVGIGLKADVFYKIVDAEKVLLVVGKDNVQPLVRETAIATLNSIIRSTSLAEVAQNKEFVVKEGVREPVKRSQDSQDGQETEQEHFFDKVHDEFIAKLQASFLEQFGISITNIRIESFKIMNRELSDNISKQALTTAQTENQLANLAGQTEIATKQMKRDTEVARIQIEGESLRLKMGNDAKNKAVMETARATAEAEVIKANAEAQAIEVRAKAEATAILLKAEAEAKRAEMLSQTKLGGEIQMYQLYADMVKSSLTGVEKMIYMPTDAMNNPLSFMNLSHGVIPGFKGMRKPLQVEDVKVPEDLD
eukprot:TRINITY_DN4885_c0_g1_i3.p1 TRINITY_DN4885_c0_g1~~TRINITY_DN4885_c0_g1_i3.p1  ORF type:complete len:828 (-),score=288.93 TRINITY_DN4885_c0_g1_i3:82-2565(-)